MRTARGVGQYAATLSHMFAASRLDHPAQTKVQGIIYAPGGNGNETSWQAGGTNTNPGPAGLALQQAVELTRWGKLGRRMVTFASEWLWGNGAVVIRIHALYNYARLGYGFDRKVHLFGVSMGAACVLNYARQKPKNVASIAIAAPVTDLQDIEDNGRATTYGLPAPSTAFSGARPPDLWNPISQARLGKFEGVPIKAWYSNNDTICTKAASEAFIEESGAEGVNIGDQTGSPIVGHGLSSGFDPAEVAAFFAAHEPVP